MKDSRLMRSSRPQVATVAINQAQYAATVALQFLYLASRDVLLVEANVQIIG
jgi:hypothetical protein